MSTADWLGLGSLALSAVNLIGGMVSCLPKGRHGRRNTPYEPTRGD